MQATHGIVLDDEDKRVHNTLYAKRKIYSFIYINRMKEKLWFLAIELLLDQIMCLKAEAEVGSKLTISTYTWPVLLWNGLRYGGGGSHSHILTCSFTLLLVSTRCTPWAMQKNAFTFCITQCYKEISSRLGSIWCDIIISEFNIYGVKLTTRFTKMNEYVISNILPFTCVMHLAVSIYYFKIRN